MNKEPRYQLSGLNIKPFNKSTLGPRDKIGIDEDGNLAWLYNYGMGSTIIKLFCTFEEACIARDKAVIKTAKAQIKSAINALQQKIEAFERLESLLGKRDERQDGK